MRILLVEDEVELGASIEQLLRGAGYAVDHVCTALAARQATESEYFDLIILDLGLPDGDGIQVVRELRHRQGQNLILVMTARDSVQSRVALLDAGADDYMVKPVAAEELCARVRSLIRGRSGLANPDIQIGQLTLDTIRHQVTQSGDVLEMSAREWAVLEYLVVHAGVIISKDQLLQAVSSWNDPLTPNAIEMQIHRLRKKIENAGITIHTVRGLGYMISEE